MGLSRATTTRTTREPSNRAFERNKMHSVRIQKKRKRRRHVQVSRHLFLCLCVFCASKRILWRFAFSLSSPFSLFSLFNFQFFFLRNERNERTNERFTFSTKKKRILFNTHTQAKSKLYLWFELAVVFEPFNCASNFSLSQLQPYLEPS